MMSHFYLHSHFIREVLLSVKQAKDVSHRRDCAAVIVTSTAKDFSIFHKRQNTDVIAQLPQKANFVSKLNP